MVDQVSGTPSAEPADDSLRASLASTLAESRKADPAPEPKATKAEPVEEGSEEGHEPTEETSAEKIADKKGHTLGQRQEPEAPEGEKPEQATEDKRAEAMTKATAKWSAADKEMLKGLDPKAQDFILSRTAAMDADYTRKTQAIAELKNEYEPIHQMFQPHMERLKAAGHTPSSLIRAWATVEDRLSSGQAIPVIQGLVQAYRIDPAQLAAALGVPTSRAGGPPPAGGAASVDPAAANADPHTAALHRQLQELTGRVQSREDAEANERRARAMNAVQTQQQAINEFKSAVDPKGAPLHPHFEALEQDMLALAEAHIRRTGKSPALQDLYDQAVYANPSTREQVLTAQAAAREAEQREQARAKAEKARKAASQSVTGGARVGGAAQPDMSKLTLREQLIANKRAAEDAA